MTAIKRLAKQASDAMIEYNSACRAGGEPDFPQWAMDVTDMVKSVDQLVAALKMARSFVPASRPAALMVIDHALAAV